MFLDGAKKSVFLESGKVRRGDARDS